MPYLNNHFHVYDQHKDIAFQIIGKGNFIRQPLFVRDFCEIILSCLVNKEILGEFDIE